MNAPQYLALGVAGIAVISTPYMLVLSIRRKQKPHVIAILRDLVMIYILLEMVFSSLPASVPRPIDWFFLLMSLLFVLDFFGLFERHARSRKGLPVERR